MQTSYQMTTRSYIDVLAYIFIRNNRVLVTRSEGKDAWYVPGGKRKSGETDQVALMREVQEELSVDLKPETITYYDTFEAQAHGEPNGVIVRMTCYFAEFDGELKPSQEIAEISFFGFSQVSYTAPAVKIILNDLKAKGLIA